MSHNEAETLIKDIREHDVVQYERTQNDYLGNVIKVSSCDHGSRVIIKKADWTDYSGWRTVAEGDLQKMTAEINRLFSYPGEVTDIIIEDDGEKEDDDLGCTP